MAVLSTVYLPKLIALTQNGNGANSDRQITDFTGENASYEQLLELDSG